MAREVTLAAILRDVFEVSPSIGMGTSTWAAPSKRGHMKVLRIILLTLTLLTALVTSVVGGGVGIVTLVKGNPVDEIAKFEELTKGMDRADLPPELAKGFDVVVGYRRAGYGGFLVAILVIALSVTLMIRKAPAAYVAGGLVALASIVTMLIMPDAQVTDKVGIGVLAMVYGVPGVVCALFGLGTAWLVAKAAKTQASSPRFQGT